MMKKLKTIVATMLAAVSALTMSACVGGGNNSAKEDPTKTYLDVGVFDAGLGTTYFDELKKDFEAYYAETPFEEGKKGVVVRALKKSTEFNPANLIGSMQNYEPVMYVLDHGDYEEFTKKNMFLDVTDVMTEKYLDKDGNIAADTGETATKSIEETMYDGYSDVYKKNGRYYAVPYMLSTTGIIYDADLFDEAKLFFKKDGTFGATAADVKAGTASVGPDGEAGTSDDGLPATWGEFLKLLDMIRNKGYIPFTWAESPTTYQLSRLFNAFWANYEGYDDYMLNYTFNGKDSQFDDIDENNFIQLLDQEGRKAAIKAFYDITKNSGNYSAQAVPGGGNTHKGALSEYVQSKRFGKRIAMTVENSYWEQETREVFESEPSQAINGYGKRNFKYMPVPEFVGVDGIADQTNTERILPAQFAESYVCLSAKNKNKNADVQVKIAKLFIKFMQQRSQLVKYTKNTGCIRPYNYTVTAEEKALCTPYTQSLLTFIEEGARLAPNLLSATKRRAYNGEIGFHETDNGFAFRARVGNSTYMDPFTYFYQNKDKTVDNAVTDMTTTITGFLKRAGAIS